MNKQLLVDVRPFDISRTKIDESIKENNGRLVVKGILQRAESKNQNGRVYPREVLMKEVQKYSETQVTERRALGELDHPDSSVVNLNNASHNVLEMHWKGDDLLGTVEILSTPAGNILKELFKRDQLKVFFTTIGFGQDSSFKNLGRRTYSIPDKLIDRQILKELLRISGLVKGNHIKTIATVDKIYKMIDRKVSVKLEKEMPDVIHSYEDCSYQTFIRAKELGIKCSYELPIAYWSTNRKLMSEEAERYPHWASTLETLEEPEEEVDEEKPQSIVIPVASMGDVSETRKKILQNTLEDELKEHFMLISQEQFEEAQEKAFEELDYEECTEDQCIMIIQEMLQVENVFHLEVIREGSDTQMSLSWRTLDEKKKETEVCMGCGTFQLNEKVGGLVGKLVGEKKVYIGKDKTKGMFVTVGSIGTSINGNHQNWFPQSPVYQML